MPNAATIPAEVCRYPRCTAPAMFGGYCERHYPQRLAELDWQGEGLPHPERVDVDGFKAAYEAQKRQRREEHNDVSESN